MEKFMGSCPNCKKENEFDMILINTNQICLYCNESFLATPTPSESVAPLPSPHPPPLLQPPAHLSESGSRERGPTPSVRPPNSWRQLFSGTHTLSRGVLVSRPIVPTPPTQNLTPDRPASASASTEGGLKCRSSAPSRLSERSFFPAGPSKGVIVGPDPLDEVDQDVKLTLRVDHPLQKLLDSKDHVDESLQLSLNFKSSTEMALESRDYFDQQIQLSLIEDNKKIPIVGGKEIDTHSIFKNINNEGGIKEVSSAGRLKQLCEPVTGTPISDEELETIRQFFTQLDKLFMSHYID